MTIQPKRDDATLPGISKMVESLESKKKRRVEPKKYKFVYDRQSDTGLAPNSYGKELLDKLPPENKSLIASQMIQPASSVQTGLVKKNKIETLKE